MRGEKTLQPDAELYKLGSPPHARGKGGDLHAHLIQQGITPACAGKSCAVKWAASQ